MNPDLDAKALAGVQDWVGQRFHRRVVIAVTEAGYRQRTRAYLVTLRCDCGQVDQVWMKRYDLLRTRQCRPCGYRSSSAALSRPRPNRQVSRPHIAARQQVVRAYHDADPLIWNEDSIAGRAAEALVRRELGAMNREEIATLVGLSRERVRQIEVAALQKLRARIILSRTPTERALEEAS